MLPLKYAHDKNFTGIIFRRTTVQVRGLGGMWDSARDIYNQLPKCDRPSMSDSNLRIKFPSGAQIVHSHMEHEKDRFNHQGLQYSLIAFDEATHFTWTQVEYLMSRLRSSAKGDSRMILSCNPDPESWVLSLIEWYLDADGFPDPEKEGKIRYFVRRNGEFIWGDTEKELKKYCVEKEERPMTFTAIFATIYDNPPCMEKNPGYLSFLKGLNDVEKARLLYGNWYARPDGSNYFERKWVTEIDKVPTQKVRWVRAWDKAATEPSDVTPEPDYTACIKMGKDTDGNYYIAGDFHPACYDEKLDVFGKFRKRPGERDNIIIEQGKYDGRDCQVILPQDPGSAGITEYRESAKKLISVGLICRKDPMPPQNSKLTRFTPFSSAAENGLIYVVTSTFNKRTLESIYKELESFNGERSTRTRKDDVADCVASAFNFLSREKVIPSFTLPAGVDNLTLKEMKKAIR